MMEFNNIKNMKKIILTIIVTFFVITNSFAQPVPPPEPTPPNKTRSNGTFTEIDHHLKVTKRFGIPTATATGKYGEIRVTSTYIYFCIAPNSWVRYAVENTF